MATISRLPLYMKEVTINVIVFTWLLFVLTNANTNLGNAYLWFLGIGTFLLFINVVLFDKHVKVTYQKEKGKHFESLFAGAVGWVIILIASFVVLNFVDPSKATFGAIVASFNSANPAFSNSVIINWITISFAIGYAETQLWSRGLEFICDRLGIQINRRNMLLISFVAVVLSLALLFMFFHLTSKGVEAVASLVIVFIMMAVSLFMVAYFNGETRQAVWTHVISNGVAGALLIAGGGVLGTIQGLNFILGVLG